MQKLILFLGLSSIKVIARRHEHEQDTPKGSKGDYQLYIFSAELPGAVCQQRHCHESMTGKLPEKGLNIHGLWPQNEDGTYPQFCTTDQYDENLLRTSTLDKLDGMWNGLYNSTFWFRTHEYNKHGTCYQDQRNRQNNQIRFLTLEQSNPQDDFFETVAELKQNFNIDSIIFSQDSWTLQDLQKQIFDAYGVTEYDLECETVNGQQALFAIYFCFDLNLQLRECPMSFLRDWHVQKRCKDTNDIVILPFNQQ